MEKEHPSVRHEDATRLGDRLQNRILKTVFAQLAQGFLDNLKRRSGDEAGPTDQELTDVFDATLSLLFRLLFVLYAESRELLPLPDPKYFSLNLRKIQDAAWQMDRSLPKFIRTDRTERFLIDNKVPDQLLAFAIEQLSRDPDVPTGTPALIDYRSLDVRCVGSIYESLLNFKLRCANECWQLRLISDRAVRNVSGTFYTPPAIVEYLIANTVGPVLDEKLNALRRDFRWAELRPSHSNGKAGDRREFDLRVIDPAMGCGHFLVEAVDFIAGRLLEFLHEFPDGPIHCVLERTRGRIFESLASQQLIREPLVLNDRQVLKRFVLEHCIYGVDLDPMAVQLAKAVLWLDAGVPGEQFGFLDHRLRCGNALVGDLPSGARTTRPKQQAKLHGFDWRTEFPEVYFNATDAEASNSTGFDCVVGNPPYVRIQNLDDALVEDLKQRYETAEGKFDLYIPFLERGTALLQQNGLLGMIVPNKLLTADYGKSFRAFAARHRLLRKLVDFGCERVFPDAGAYSCLVFLGGPPSDNVSVSIGSLEPPIARETAIVSCERFGAASWSVRTAVTSAHAKGVPLNAACRAIFQGLITGADRLFIGIRNGDRIRLGKDEVDFDPGIFLPVLKGPDVRRFGLRFSHHYVLFPYRLVDGKTELLPEDELAAGHPGAYRYLTKRRRELNRRGSPSMVYPAWYAHWCPRTIERFAAPKIVTQVLASKASFALDTNGAYTFVGGGNAGVYGIIPEFADEDRLLLLLAVLNSHTFDAQVQAGSSHFRGGYFSYARRFIENAATPDIQTIDLSASLPRRIVELVKHRADGPAECHNRLEAELDDAVDELYQCGIR